MAYDPSKPLAHQLPDPAIEALFHNAKFRSSDRMSRVVETLKSEEYKDALNAMDLADGKQDGRVNREKAMEVLDKLIDGSFWRENPQYEKTWDEKRDAEFASYFIILRVAVEALPPGTTDGIDGFGEKIKAQTERMCEDGSNKITPQSATEFYQKYCGRPAPKTRTSNDMQAAEVPVKPTVPAITVKKEAEAEAPANSQLSAKPEDVAAAAPKAEPETKPAPAPEEELEITGDAYNLKSGDTLYSIAATQDELRDKVRAELEKSGIKISEKQLTLATSLMIGVNSQVEDAHRMKVGTTMNLALTDEQIAAGVASLQSGILDDGKIEYSKEVANQPLSTLLSLTPSTAPAATTPETETSRSA